MAATRKAKRSEPRIGNTTVRLAAVLERSLSAYASAAAAAGVSLLALTPAANAKIVYTPADTPIPVDHPVLVDLNHDGVADFFLWNLFSNSGFSLRVGCVSPPPRHSTCNYQTNQIWGRGVFPSALPGGFKVRPNKSYFQPGPALGEPMLALFGDPRSRHSSTSTVYFEGSEGQWLYAKNRYLGLQFVIKGQVHYGWARLSVTYPDPSVSGFGIYAVLTGYAYEDVPNKSIITGKTKGPDVVTLDPATLGHLAAGVSQIPAWRARNLSAALQDSRRKAAPEP